MTPAITSVQQPVWLTPAEAAQHLRLNKRLLYRFVDQKRLRAVRVGRSLRFKVSWLDEFMESMVVEIDG